MLRFCLLYAMLALVCANTPLVAQTYYVATTGSDSSDGSFDHPFRTIPKAISVSTVPGTTIYVRGGIYAYSATITLSRSGNNVNMYNLLAYPGERPFLDFSSTPTGTRGIRVSGSYWHIRGFDIWKAGDNGMNVSGSNNIIEFCSFSENGDTGLQLGGGASNNRVINCDSYFNVDTSQGNADGFAPKLDVGTGNYFYGCRAWQNSDDGWDGYLRPSNNVRTTLENCWCFMNGYLKTGLPSSGNGNGFKMGGGDNGNADSLRHDMTLKNCLAFDNRVKGYDQNNNRGSMVLLNCTGYRNGTNYSISGAIAAGESVAVKNCVALGSYGSLGSYAIQLTNSWMPQFSVTNSDFVSIDTAGIRGPRNADGSLPSLPFMHLAPGSDLIDAGTYVGLPYNGFAPDLGCFESVSPMLHLAPSVLNFGSVMVHVIVRDTVKVRNVGGLVVHVDSIRTYRTEFAATPTSSVMLPVGDSLLVIVSFSPTSVGSLIAHLVVFSDAMTSPDSVFLTGSGIESSFSGLPNPLSFGSVTVGENAIDSITVTNSGTATLVIDSVRTFGGEFAVNPSGGRNVQSGASVKFAVTFSPTSLGAHSGGTVFYSNSALSPDTIVVMGIGTNPTVSLQVSISSGWNMISNPVTSPVPDDSVKHLFPTIISRAFEFDGGYQPRETMENGKGYWGKFPTAVADTITGTPLTRDSISVLPGWNMVGSISSTVDTSAIISVPSGLRASSWFGYSLSGYLPVTLLGSGMAYWVKSNGTGKFIFVGREKVNLFLPPRGR